MAEIINLQKEREDRRPHLSGQACCMLCAHEWIAVAPVGETWVECPVCHAHKGYLTYPVQRLGLEWQCACGNDLFRITPDGPYCPNCGVRQISA